MGDKKPKTKLKPQLPAVPTDGPKVRFCSPSTSADVCACSLLVDHTPPVFSYMERSWAPLFHSQWRRRRPPSRAAGELLSTIQRRTEAVRGVSWRKNFCSPLGCFCFKIYSKSYPVWIYFISFYLASWVSILTVRIRAASLFRQCPPSCGFIFTLTFSNACCLNVVSKFVSRFIFCLNSPLVSDLFGVYICAVVLRKPILEMQFKTYKNRYIYMCVCVYNFIFNYFFFENKHGLCRPI